MYLAPAVGGREPRFQRLGVNALFVALVAVVFGSLAGEWLSVQQVFGLDAGFWFGHQGYEYVDPGRFWQIGLFLGLLLWLVLMLRGLWPALKRKVFLLGVGSLAWFVIGLKTGWSYAKKEEDSEQFVAVTSNRVEGLAN